MEILILILFTAAIRIYFFQLCFSSLILLFSAFTGCQFYKSKLHVFHTFMPWYIPLTVIKYIFNIGKK